MIVCLMATLFRAPFFAGFAGCVVKTNDSDEFYVGAERPTIGVAEGTAQVRAMLWLAQGRIQNPIVCYDATYADRAFSDFSRPKCNKLIVQE